MDALCYHAGGPLQDGDIEDIVINTSKAGSSAASSPGDGAGLDGAEGATSARVVVCPWHSYRFDLTDGQCYYQALSREWKTKGVKQRTHAVWVNTSTRRVWVRVSQPAKGGSAASGAGPVPGVSTGGCGGSVCSGHDELPSDAYTKPGMVERFIETAVDTSSAGSHSSSGSGPNNSNHNNDVNNLGSSPGGRYGGYSSDPAPAPAPAPASGGFVSRIGSFFRRPAPVANNINMTGSNSLSGGFNVGVGLHRGAGAEGRVEVPIHSSHPMAQQSLQHGHSNNSGAHGYNAPGHGGGGGGVGVGVGVGAGAGTGRGPMRSGQVLAAAREQQQNQRRLLEQQQLQQQQQQQQQLSLNVQQQKMQITGGIEADGDDSRFDEEGNEYE